MSDTGFSNSSGTGGNPGRDYLSVSTDMNQQLTGDTRNFGGGVGDRTQGSGRFGATNIQQPSQGDQYGSSGGYSGKSLSAEPDTSGIQTQDTRGQGDMVDKGIDYLEKKLGHEQVRLLFAIEIEDFFL